MSFFTSVIFYRPTTPPVITTLDLSRLISSVQGLHCLSDRCASLKVKYGSSIDQDEKETRWIEEVSPLFSRSKEIDWDLNVEHVEGLDALETTLIEGRRIYRAHIGLGQPTKDMLEPITRHSSVDNEIGFYPDFLSIEVGPINLSALSSEKRWRAGWVGLILSGNGYLYPWTLHDLVPRLTADAKIQQLCALCESLWPVEPLDPTSEVVKARRRNSALWPYETPYQKMGWCWGMNETG